MESLRVFKVLPETAQAIGKLVNERGRRRGG
jgi:hypothetical protein